MKKNINLRLRDGDTVWGTMITLPAPEVAEAMACLGFDWLFIDGEHGSFETQELKHILQAVADRTSVFVRVPAIDEVPIKKALDLGAHGIIVPLVNNAEDASHAVRYSRYPPLGGRGIGIGRAHGYGKSFEEYVAVANDEICLVLQAEHVAAVENIESIIKVPGFDVVLIGPYDLSASMGRIGEVDHPEVVQAIHHVAEVCRAAKIPLGFFGATAESVRPYVEQGFQLIVSGIDTVMLTSAADQLLTRLKELE